MTKTSNRLSSTNTATPQVRRTRAAVNRENENGPLAEIQNTPVPANPPKSAELVNKDILERLEKLEAENERLRAQQHDSSGEVSVDSDNGAAAEYKRKYMELEKKYSELEAARFNSSEPATSGSVPDGSIPRPPGTAGQNYSIQVAMGLAGSEKQHLVYQGIMRLIKDLAHRGGLNWELTWSEIDMDKKLKVFQLAREKQRFLRRFRNDWATEDILKQYFKNRRAYGYSKGFLEAPSKYAYLKENSRKRSSDGSHTKKAKAILSAKKKDKVSSVSGAKGKQRARVISDDDDDDEETDGSVNADDMDDVYMTNSHYLLR